uniref:Single domain-containing protein n=1 Tax=Stomoxys calcitrans TaxID=35570 RepID=A0A1I8NMG6_STOCA
MKFLVFTAFVTLFTVGFAYQSVGYYNDPAHPGKCVYQGMVLSPGEEGKVKGKCVSMLCANEDGLATVLGCPEEYVGPPCKLGDFVNIDAAYGECCRRHVICS